jgi:hypothetical protein
MSATADHYESHPVQIHGQGPPASSGRGTGSFEGWAHWVMLTVWAVSVGWTAWVALWGRPIIEVVFGLVAAALAAGTGVAVLTAAGWRAITLRARPEEGPTVTSGPQVPS